MMLLQFSTFSIVVNVFSKKLYSVRVFNGSRILFVYLCQEKEKRKHCKHFFNENQVRQVCCDDVTMTVMS